MPEQPQLLYQWLNYTKMPFTKYLPNIKCFQKALRQRHKNFYLFLIILNTLGGMHFPPNSKQQSFKPAVANLSELMDYWMATTDFKLSLYNQH